MPFLSCIELESRLTLLMYVTRVPNCGSPPAILLRQGYRAGAKVKTRTLANLSR